jgi:hypothetical protein
MNEQIKFSFNNSKIKSTAKVLKSRGIVSNVKEVVCFDLPAGWTCPKANLCKSKVNPDTGIKTDYGNSFVMLQKQNQFIQMYAL